MPSTGIPWPTSQSNVPPASTVAVGAFGNHNQLRNSHSQIQGAMVSRVLPVTKPDLTPFDFGHDEVIEDRSFIASQRLARVQGLDPLAIKKAGKYLLT